MVRIAHGFGEADAAPADGRIVVVGLGQDGLLVLTVQPASGGSLLARAAAYEPPPVDAAAPPRDP